MKATAFLNQPFVRRLAFGTSTRAAPAPALRGFFTSTLFAPTRQKPSQTLLYRQFRPLLRVDRSFILQRLRSVRFNTSKSSPKPDPTQHLGRPEPAPSLSQRLKKLSREYGWSALGVYLLLSALDFPFCFLAVRMLGTDRIGHYEHVVIEAFWTVVRIPFPNLGKAKQTEKGNTAGETHAAATAREGVVGWSGEVEQAEANNRGAQATIWTQLALAYAIHKSFIFIRVPLTAAVTPKVVKMLRGWGWDIGKRRPKVPKTK